MGKRLMSVAEIGAITKPGRYAVGGQVVLQLRQPNANETNRSWLFRYRMGDRQREMGLGPAKIGTSSGVTLAEARIAAEAARRLLRAGVDPLAHRQAQLAQQAAEKARGVTFDTFSARFIDRQAPGWRNAKHRQQWENTLATYASPIIGSMPVGAIVTSNILRVLTPIWTTKPETATRVRMRLEAILDAAKAEGLVSGENPARWKGHLATILPKRSKVARVEHHAAIPWASMPPFIDLLRQQEGTAARALEFAIFTAARTGEVLGAQWAEIDIEARLWLIPANRMKASREHRVPLSDAALGVLQDMGTQRDGDLIFPGQRKGKPLSNMAMLMLLRRMGRGDITAHGFRSTFRDWVAEATSFPGEVAEAALAHIVGDKTEAAYRRGDALEKRRALMAAWARHCAAPAVGNFVAVKG